MYKVGWMSKRYIWHDGIGHNEGNRGTLGKARQGREGEGW